jgi:7-cyano-7-deazaguanine synthase in queuosine biosynthesis
VNWNLNCRVGDDDIFSPGGGNPILTIEFDAAGRSQLAKNRVFEILRDNEINAQDTMRDLINLALSVYTGDLRIERSFSRDHWQRNITLHLPVVDLARWQESTQIIQDMLSFLTGDHWTVLFRARNADPVISPGDLPVPDAMVLFSGGLDSFAGAIDVLEEREGLIGLVGQYGSGSTSQSQEQTHQVLNNEYPDRSRRYGFWAQPSRPGERSSENTMRSRSILFLALGTVMAAARGHRRTLFVPENGFISLNVPLSYSRMGSLSTRTTHPHFISLYRQLLTALAIDVEVRLPYRFRTKGEMLNASRNRDVLLQGLPATVSCSRPDAGRYQKRPPGTHCGYCVPCIIRLSAMHAAGINLAGAAYFDVAHEHAGAGTVRGTDRRGFELAIAHLQELSPLRLAAETAGAGPFPPEDINQYADMYRRGLLEVGAFLNQA